MALRVIHLDTPTLGDRSYIAHDGTTAVVVDPQRDIDRVQEILDREGVRVGAVIETHMHNDYVTGGLVLAREHGAEYVVSDEDPVSFERRGVVDSEIVPVGSFAVQALHTPGHTFTHLSYALLDGQDAVGVFTGGSLLHGSTGRPDLLGPDHAATLAALQHGSAHRLADLLEDRVPIHPTHGFGSFCAATSTSGTASTIGDERVGNPALLLDREAFVTSTLAALDAFPAYYRHMGPANHAGPGPIDLSDLPRMSTDEVQRAMSEGAWIVDTRTRTEYAREHLVGSLSFGLDGSFATYLGWLFPYERPLVLMSDKASDISEAQRELVRIGIDRPAGSYVGDVADFPERSSIRTVTFHDVPGVLADPSVVVLDVRRNGERRASHIEGSQHIPLHELVSRMDEVPTDREVWVHCAGAYRASAAVGLLERAGRRPVLINEPYEAALTVRGLPFVTGEQDHGPTAAHGETALAVSTR